MIDMSKQFEKYPMLLSASDLVEIGLYASIDAAYIARRRGWSPAFIKLEHKVLYPKDGVIAFLEDRLKSGIEATL